MSQNSPTLLPSRETGASPSCLLYHCGALPFFHLVIISGGTILTVEWLLPCDGVSLYTSLLM